MNLPRSAEPVPRSCDEPACRTAAYSPVATMSTSRSSMGIAGSATGIGGMIVASCAVANARSITDTPSCVIT